MSGITAGTALAIGLGTSAAGGIASSVIGSQAAGNAASTQSNASEYAANLQQEEAQQALQFQQEVYGQQQQNEFPYLQTGESALGNLANLLGLTIPNANAGTASLGGTNLPGAPSTGPQGPTGGRLPPRFGLANTGSTSNLGAPVPTGETNWGGAAPRGAPGAITLGNGLTLPQLPSLASTINPNLGSTGSLLAPWTQQFQAPTAAEAAQYPGYQFQLQQGEQAIQDSAAAQGDLLSGKTVNAEDQYAQGLAQNDYTNVYNQRLQQYQQGYNIFENNQANTYNRLASLAGLGQTATSNLNSAGSNAANTAGNICWDPVRRSGRTCRTQEPRQPAATSTQPTRSPADCRG